MKPTRNIIARQHTTAPTRPSTPILALPKTSQHNECPHDFSPHVLAHDPRRSEIGGYAADASHEGSLPDGGRLLSRKTSRSMVASDLAAV